MLPLFTISNSKSYFKQNFLTEVKCGFSKWPPQSVIVVTKRKTQSTSYLDRTLWITKILWSKMTFPFFFSIPFERNFWRIIHSTYYYCPTILDNFSWSVLIIRILTLKSGAKILIMSNVHNRGCVTFAIKKFICDTKCYQNNNCTPEMYEIIKIRIYNW